MSQIINPNSTNQSLDQQQQALQFAKILKVAPDMECEQCKNKTFNSSFVIKIVSGLVTGTGREMIVPIGVYGCAKCGHINKYFMDKLEETEEA